VRSARGQYELGRNTGNASQLTSLEIEFDVCIFLLLGTVVVRATLDSVRLLDNTTMVAEGDCLHLNVAQLELCRWVLMRDDNTQRDQHTETEGHGREEAEHILYPYQRRMHLGSTDVRCGVLEFQASSHVAFT
jgi:hypothetical protein